MPRYRAEAEPVTTAPWLHPSTVGEDLVGLPLLRQEVVVEFKIVQERKTTLGAVK